MGKQELGALWDAWRTRSDEAALLQLLDEVEPELLRAARRYTRDEASAHDLVQQTWQAALSKAHAYDAEQPLVPWLIGFLLVESKRERRRSARGVDPERLHAREEPPPDHAASADEQRRMVRSAVASLPQLYREVVELTYERGLEPAQIAVQLDRAPGTVRVQLHRGLAKLRATLPASLSLGVAIVLLGGSSEAALRATLVDTALSHADEIARAAPPAAAATAGAWKLSLSIAGVVVIAGVAAWWALSRTDANTTSEPLATNARVETGRTSAVSALEAESSATQRASASRPIDVPKPDANGVFLVGTVRGFEPQPQTERFAVVLRPSDTKIEPFLADVPAGARFEVDVSAWYAAGAPKPREFFCVVDTPRSMPARVNVWLDDARLAAAQSASTQRIEIPLTVELEPAVCVVTGRALVPAGAPRTGRDALAYAALLELRPDGFPAAEPTEAVAASSDGRFRLRSSHAGSHALVILSSGARPTTVSLDLRPGSDQNVGDVPFEAGASLAGTVLREDGKPAAGARVSVQLKDADRARSLHGHPLVWMKGRFEHPALSVRCDEHGLFFVDTLAPLDYSVGVADGPGPRSWSSTLTLDDTGFGAAKGSTPVESKVVTAPASGIDLRTSVMSLSLRVTLDGAPLASCDVNRLFDDGGSVGSLTDAEGIVELRAAHPLTTRLRVSKLGCEPVTITITPAQLETGEPIELALLHGPAPAWVTFEAGAVSTQGTTAYLAPVEEIPESELSKLEKRETPLLVPGLVFSNLDATGRMQTAMRPGHYKGLLLDTSNGGMKMAFRPTWFDIDVPPGVEYRFHVNVDVGGQFRIPPPVYAGTQKRLSITLTDENGTVVPVEFTSSVLRTDARAGQTRGKSLLAGASNLSNALHPGTYTVHVSAPDARPFEARIVIEAGKTVELPVALEPL